MSKRRLVCALGYCQKREQGDQGWGFQCMLHFYRATLSLSRDRPNSHYAGFQCGWPFGICDSAVVVGFPSPLDRSAECYCIPEDLHAGMALNIRNPEAEMLAAELARQTGESKTDAVVKALRDRLARVRRERSKRCLADELEDIAKHCASLAVIDDRPADEILGYDKHGLPR